MPLLPCPLRSSGPRTAAAPATRLTRENPPKERQNFPANEDGGSSPSYQRQQKKRRVPLRLHVHRSCSGHAENQQA